MAIIIHELFITQQKEGPLFSPQNVAGFGPFVTLGSQIFLLLVFGA